MHDHSPPPILYTTLSQKKGGGFYRNIQLVWTIRPQKGKIEINHDDFTLAVRMNSSNVGHVLREFSPGLPVLCTEEC